MCLSYGAKMFFEIFKKAPSLNFSVEKESDVKIIHLKETAVLKKYKINMITKIFKNNKNTLYLYISQIIEKFLYLILVIFIWA